MPLSNALPCHTNIFGASPIVFSMTEKTVSEAQKTGSASEKRVWIIPTAVSTTKNIVSGISTAVSVV